jgi:Holliday junction resolvase RusA-like endonuclease
MAEAIVKTASFFLPGRLPGANEIRAMLTRKGGYRRYNAVKSKVHAAVAIIVAEERVGRFPSAHVTFEWVEPNMRRDPDNFSQPKAILDALQHAGVLPNDGWKEILSISHKWRVDRNRPGVYVTLAAPE